MLIVSAVRWDIARWQLVCGTLIALPWASVIDAMATGEQYWPPLAKAA